MLPDLVDNLRSLVASQYAEADRAIYGRTWKRYSRPSHQKRRLAVADWKVLSESQRQRVRLAVFCLMNEGVAGTKQSTSTDGNLTVLHRPDAGKKLYRQSSSTKGRLHSHSKQKKKKIVTV